MFRFGIQSFIWYLKFLTQCYFTSNYAISLQILNSGVSDICWGISHFDQRVLFWFTSLTYLSMKCSLLQSDIVFYCNVKPHDSLPELCVYCKDLETRSDVFCISNQCLVDLQFIKLPFTFHCETNASEEQEIIFLYINHIARRKSCLLFKWFSSLDDSVSKELYRVYSLYLITSTHLSVLR